MYSYSKCPYREIDVTGSPKAVLEKGAPILDFLNVALYFIADAVHHQDVLDLTVHILKIFEVAVTP